MRGASHLRLPALPLRPLPLLIGGRPTRFAAVTRKGTHVIRVITSTSSEEEQEKDTPKASKSAFRHVSEKRTLRRRLLLLQLLPPPRRRKRRLRKDALRLLGLPARERVNRSGNGKEVPRHLEGERAEARPGSRREDSPRKRRGAVAEGTQTGAAGSSKSRKLGFARARAFVCCTAGTRLQRYCGSSVVSGARRNDAVGSPRAPERVVGWRFSLRAIM